MKPLISENEILLLLDGVEIPRVFAVHSVENVSMLQRFGTVQPMKLTPFTEIDIVEPESKNAPEAIIYQLRSGIDIGRVYTQMMIGHQRNSPWKGGMPNESNMDVAFWDENMSPYHSPRVEMFVRHNEKPAYMVGNPYQFPINPVMMIRGRKLRVFEMTLDDMAKNNITAKAMKWSSGEKVSRYAKMAIEGEMICRRITQFGIERR